MVAAGGGGSGSSNNGRTYGNNGLPGGTFATSGAGQTWGNAFGIGGNGQEYRYYNSIWNNYTYSDFSGGAGGGYYGGTSRPGKGCLPGFGGSSFISGYYGRNNTVCNAIDQNGNHTGQPLHYSGYYFDHPDMGAGVRTGNGVAYITYVGEENSYKSEKKAQYLTLTSQETLDIDYKTTTVKGQEKKLEYEITNAINTFGNVHPSSELDIKFTSLDENIATISENGTITGVEKGTARIVIESSLIGMSRTIFVNVVSENHEAEIEKVVVTDQNTYALAEDGIVRYWGTNKNGQNGDGTTSNSDMEYNKHNRYRSK